MQTTGCSNCVWEACTHRPHGLWMVLQTQQSFWIHRRLDQNQSHVLACTRKMIPTGWKLPIGRSEWKQSLVSAAAHKIPGFQTGRDLKDQQVPPLDFVMMKLRQREVKGGIQETSSKNNALPTVPYSLFQKTRKPHIVLQIKETGII